jgi:acetyl-CoA acyltransferase
MLAHVIRTLVDRHPGRGGRRGAMGCANQAGEDNRNVARMAALLAGCPTRAGGHDQPALRVGAGCGGIGRACRRMGEADVVIACGVESMSRAPMVMPKADSAFSRRAEIYDTTIGWRFVNREMHKHYGTDSMPETAENVATDYQISRADQDAFALRSQTRALAAQANGRLAREIVAVTIPQRKGDPVVVERDEHPRETSAEKLASLPTPFRTGGIGHRRQCLGRQRRRRGGDRRLGRGGREIRADAARAGQRHGHDRGAAADHGDRPGAGDREADGAHGLSIGDIDVIELNEAFAAQGLAVMRQLGLPDDADHVNPHGGAIALGHPLGMSGTRLALTASVTMDENDMDRAICTMCIGVGQGIALLLEKA